MVAWSGAEVNLRLAIQFAESKKERLGGLDGAYNDLGYVFAAAGEGRKKRRVSIEKRFR